MSQNFFQSLVNSGGLEQFPKSQKLALLSKIALDLSGVCAAQEGREAHYGELEDTAEKLHETLQTIYPLSSLDDCLNFLKVLLDQVTS